jgi:hypothetical protein
MVDMLKITTRSILAIVTAVLFVGCGGKPCEQPANKICAQGVKAQAAMTAAQRTLEEMHFTIEKADTNAGYIRTRPLAAGQFFEVWRSDTVGGENFAEANLHSITRVVEINIVPRDDAVCIECSVATRRLSMPQREVSSATELPGVFAKSSGGMQSLKLDRAQKQDAVWMDMGPDAKLQAKIIERIGTQISRAESFE